MAENLPDRWFADFLGRVRLFEPCDLMAMLTEAGFEVLELCGDYGGGGWTAAAPRAIVIARRRFGAASVALDGRCVQEMAVPR